MKNRELEYKKYESYGVDFEYLDDKVEFFFTALNNETHNKKFFEIVSFFKETKIIEHISSSFQNSFKVKCKESEYTIQCNNPIARQVLSVILNLQKNKESIHSDWYLYDYDSCNEMPQFIHSFFLVSNYQIISENVKISTSWMDECDQNILIKSSDDSPPLWSNERVNEKAITHWCYQKFYRETRVGQILDIREKSQRGSPLSSNDVLLASINRSLKWLAIGVGLILLKMFL